MKPRIMKLLQLSFKALPINTEASPILDGEGENNAVVYKWKLAD
jgi:hypothetical protein